MPYYRVLLIYAYASAKAAGINKVSEHLHSTYRYQIEHNLDLFDKKLSFIAPNNTVKRGIKNWLGSVVRLITGNLDNENAIHLKIKLTKYVTQFLKFKLPSSDLFP